MSLYLEFDKSDYQPRDNNTGVLLRHHMAGDIFEPEDISTEEIYQLVRNENKIPKLVGEFILFLEDSDFVYVINDEISTIKWFYQIDETAFRLSNNLWEIAKAMDVCVDDIDRKSIYEQILLNQTLTSTTIIKGIKTVPAGSILAYSKNSHSFTLKKYTEIKYTQDADISKDELFEKIDYLFDKTVKKIAENNRFNQEEYNVGVTISGGLDSRFPLPYLEKNNLTALGYLIGIHKGFLQAYDYKSAARMASMYDLSLKFINPFDTDIKDKILIDLMRKPEANCNIMKAISYEESFANNKFSVLVTGAYGGMIGGRVLNDSLLNASNVRELSDSIFYDYSMLKRFNQVEKGHSIFIFVKEALRRLNALYFNNSSASKDTRESEFNAFRESNFLFDKDYKNYVINVVEDFVRREHESYEDNLTTIMKVHLYRHSIRGAFESLHGQVKSYSIYHPYIYEFSKTWPVQYLQNRTIMEEFLLSKYPELAAVPLQTYDMPINYRFEKIVTLKKYWLKTIALVNFTFRGLAINYNSWWKNRKLKKVVRDTFNKNTYFYTLFDQNDVELLLSYPRYNHLMEQLFKVKLLVDAIETGEYIKYCESSIPQDLKY